MPPLFKFTTLSLRDLIVTFGPVILLAAGLCVLAYRIIDPSPPKVVTISTGQENSAYELLARRYAAALARQGIQVIQKRSQGSYENLQRLNDPDAGIDIAFVQSGSTDLQRAESHGLISLGSLFTEPIWLFYRDKKSLRHLRDLKGLRINVGPAGTGVPQVFGKILAANGIESKDLTLRELENTPATVALLSGAVDGMVFSSAADALLIQMLLQTPGIKLFDFSQAEAYTRRFPFLSGVVLPRGIVDFGRDIPARDYHLIAPTATLVAREDLHPALVDLFVQAASEIHGGAGWFQRHGEFPTASYTEIPVAATAEKFYRNGPPFLQRYMSFWLANFFERMWIVIVPLGALLLPLSRIVPPLYVWKVRSRIYRWYGQLRIVEQALEDVPPGRRDDVFMQQLARLNDIEQRVNQLSIPLSFAEEAYRLRSHIHFVRKRAHGLLTAAPDQAPTQGKPALHQPAMDLR